MRAIILAAGRGSRLSQSQGPQQPKCLLKFAGVSLLERHLRLLQAAGVTEVVMALGFEHRIIEAELLRLAALGLPRPEIVINERFTLGSVLTVQVVADAMRRGGDVLLMDADVLYDARIMQALAGGATPSNRILIDRDFETGDEPVKVCVRDGIPVELRKQVAPDLQYDTIGESVGFFRFDERAARRLAELVADCVESGRANLPHEETVRDLILERSQVFQIVDVTGAPWIEIDFPADVERAAREVLPQLVPQSGAAA
ncbi:MAG TPA: phosphocholine cytidylyltransferase family protein [Steroidobacteraceae bacterium]|jgi:choline kinase|nr:phosphocholine cytidylyltransferase family protein [Steroidobacteraceae bacterium]